jgi:membrane protein implicated in regulation of membrane protease activity
MKTTLILIVFLAIIWLPVVLKLYSWKEAMILTLSLSIASYLIDRFMPDGRKKTKDK